MHRASVAVSASGGVSVWRAALQGLCALFIGIGLARFAYTPLIPALIAAQWFTPSEAAYLGAGNLAGYFAGALLARPLAARFPAATVLRAGMALATAGFFACATPLSFFWFFLWRFAAGVSGGVLMVLTAPAILPRVAAARRGLVGGIIFTGVGLGIAASGTLVPLLLHRGLTATWCGLGALALVLTAAAWNGWPQQRMLVDIARHRRRRPARLVLAALCIVYALVAVGLVPHMVFLVDFVARGLGEGVAAGAWYWVLFGLGAVAGPAVAGHAADRIGFALALRLALVAAAVLVGLIAVSASTAVLTVSSIVIGGFVPGSVVLVLGRARELVPDDLAGQQAAWSFATIAFALGQAGAAYGFSLLFARGHGYALFFALGAAAFALALAIDLVSPLAQRR
jgi:predicted MFS family arabinose efflux permease